MNTKEIIEKLKIGTLSELESEKCIQFLINNDCNAEQKSSILSLMEGRKPSLEEINGFSNYILSQCIVPFTYKESLMDVCGTGGDGNSTVNISTLIALVLAATGIKICKHGNYGVTSINGSSGILENLGYKFKTSNEELLAELDELNITFLHAPLFHPALKNIAPVRKNMQMKTIFNILGPMVNPLQPYYRYTGVSNLYTARVYHFLYQQKNIKYNIIHTLDGNDEVTLTDSCKIYSHNGEHFFRPDEFSDLKLNLNDLLVFSMDDAAKKFNEVLNNCANESITEVVLVNSALAYQLKNEADDFVTAKSICHEALKSGKVKSTFKKLIK